jgi:PiT family inorganic phosphate transporter
MKKYLSVRNVRSAGVPVSLSQALVGPVLGLGFARGIKTVKLTVLGNIVIAWIAAQPISASLIFVCRR